MLWKKRVEPTGTHASVTDGAAPIEVVESTLGRRADELVKALRAFEQAVLDAERSAPPAPEAVEIREKIDAAEKIVVEGHIYNALVGWLMDHTEHWHAWSTRDDFQKWIDFDATEIDAEMVETSTDGRRGYEFRNFFTFNGKRYGVVWRDKWDTGGSRPKFGDAEFWDNDRLVLKLGLADDMDGGGWRFLDVQALTLGEWMQDLLAMAAQIEGRATDMDGLLYEMKSEYVNGIDL